VLSARTAPSEHDNAPGTIVPDERGLALATSDGRLILDEVQPAGARPMSGEAFLRGRPAILGASVGPGDATPRVARAAGRSPDPA
jgi:methionyl-tRNA formyltransferase